MGRVSIRTSRNVLAGVLGAAGVVAVVGCTRKTETTLPEPPVVADPEPAVAAEPAARADELAGLAQQLSATASRLPGGGDPEFRQTMQELFGALGRILPLLYGPGAGGGAFQQRLRIVENARTRLAGGAATAPEPTVDEGLRAATAAVRDLARRAYSGDKELTEALDQLSKSVDALDVARGPAHQAAAADAARLLARVVGRMSAAMSGGLTPAAGGSGGAGPATSPE